MGGIPHGAVKRRERGGLLQSRASAARFMKRAQDAKKVRGETDHH